ncbi:MAG: TlpA disulfide reductase family protein [Chloroherpetonaceae bacterium]|nr:TlpA family protein disulfide reductase [Chloroherpetonaceae bacterium]MDW8019627.1 TlpA disulfide reductase family protein [Chloroherpetonaceae bacterium]
MKKFFSWILPLGLAAAAGLLLGKYVIVPILSPKPAVSAFASAPNFTIQTLDNRSLSLADLRGKGVIINFWATWCPPCRAEIPAMVELQKQYSDKFTFVGIAVNDQEAKVKAFVEEKAINYPVAMDNGIANEYAKLIQGGIRGIPTSFAIDKNGNVIDVIVGMGDKAKFEEIIKKTIK